MCGKDANMTHTPHSSKFYHYISDRYHIIKIFIMFPIVTFLIGFIYHAQISSADNFSVFNLKLKSHTIDMSHNKLTQSFQLKKDIVYNDTLRESSINFYYINNPDSLYKIYIQPSNNSIPTNYIQLFDNTYKEIKYYIHKKSSYLYIDLKTTLSELNDKNHIYITIGNNSNTTDTLLKIAYTRKQQQSKNIHTTKTKNKPTNNKLKQDNKSANNSKLKPHNKSTNNNKSDLKNKINEKKTVLTKNKQPNKINKSQKNDTSNNKKKIIKKTTRKKHIASKIKKDKHTSKNKLLSISLSHRYISIKVGEYAKLKYNIVPLSIKKYTAKWTTSNPKTITVSNGKIKAVHTGLAIIKIEIKHNNITKTATCTIRITK